MLEALKNQILEGDTTIRLIWDERQKALQTLESHFDKLRFEWGQAKDFVGGEEKTISISAEDEMGYKIELERCYSSFQVPFIKKDNTLGTTRPSHLYSDTLYRCSKALYLQHYAHFAKLITEIEHKIMAYIEKIYLEKLERVNQTLKELA